jgi:hypothetical protein
MSGVCQTVCLEIEGHLIAGTDRADYGVPGSPVWDEIRDVEVSEITINGQTYNLRDLRAKTAADFLQDLLTEAADSDGWESRD